MKIGITCYPTYGGSGVVATELGLELAARGYDVHFKFGGNHARTAIRRVASDPNLHIVPSVPLVLLLVSARLEAVDFL